jgi:hypothetical protein
LKYEVSLVNCILKNTYDILREDPGYEIKVIPFDLSLFVEYEWVEALKSSEYPHVTLPSVKFKQSSDIRLMISLSIRWLSMAFQSGGFEELRPENKCLFSYSFFSVMMETNSLFYSFGKIYCKFIVKNICDYT